MFVRSVSRATTIPDMSVGLPDPLLIDCIMLLSGMYLFLCPMGGSGSSGYLAFPVVSDNSIRHALNPAG